MRVIIIGAGEVGRGLAATLCLENNDVIMVDQDEKLLEELSETLDIMTYAGNGATPHTLNKINVDKAQLLVAVTNRTEANVLACQMAKIVNPELRTVCRVDSSDYFIEEKGFTPENMGIDHVVVPQVECTEAIFEALENKALKEVVHLSSPGAVIAAFQISPGSPMIGSQLFNFPRRDLLEKLRICAVWRRGRMIIPRGKERFNNYDEIYVAGKKEDVKEMIDWATIDDHKLQEVIIVGAGTLGLSLADRLVHAGVHVKVIEPNKERAEKALDQLSSKITILHGDATSSEVLEEAGVENCDAYISTDSNDEYNVLATLMAKRQGAEKVIAVVNKPDYREIISSMDSIDCCFSPRIAALNTIINLIKGSDRRIGAMLNRIAAEVYEMTVVPKCKVAEKQIKESPCPDDAVFAMILRGNVIIPATGNETFQIGDRVVLMGTPAAMKKSEALFMKRTFL